MPLLPALLPQAARCTRSPIQPKPASRMLSMKRLRRWCPHPPGHFRPRWLRHLVRAGLPQQLRCGYRRCCSSAWFGGCLSLCCYYRQDTSPAHIRIELQLFYWRSHYTRVTYLSMPIITLYCYSLYSELYLLSST